MNDAPIATPPGSAAQSRAVALLSRYRGALALLSFGAGVGSFVLVQRQESLAQWIALLLALTWLLALTEGTLGRWLARWRWARLSPLLVRYGTQAVHQETFFFCLPFFIATTTWGHGQAVFTAALVGVALCSMWDPVYYGRIAARPWLFLAYHAFAVYVATLTVAPMLGHLTTTETLALASGVVAVLAVPTLAQVIDRGRWSHWLLLLIVAPMLGYGAWRLREFVPPATLWVSEALVTQSVDVAAKAPGAPVGEVAERAVHANGLYAFTAIRAPRGLRERVYHRWLQDGTEMDRIALEIVGGRGEGYRAWSFKHGFPREAAGPWEVQVVTESGQLIGLTRFRVVPASAQQAVDQPRRRERESARDDQPDEGPAHEPAVAPDVTAPDGDDADRGADEGPGGEQVDPGVAPGTELLDPEGQDGEGEEQQDPEAPDPAVGDGALGADELDGSEDQRGDGEDQVQPDDG